MADDPYKYFRLEARDLLDQSSAALLELEKGGGAAHVQRMLRIAHTLKGAARVVKQPEIADGAHAVEDALSPFRDDTDGLRHADIETVRRHLDAILERFSRLDGTDESPAPTVAPSAAAEPVRTIRAEIAEVDTLLDSITETHALVTGLRSTLRTVEEVQRLAELVTEQLAPRQAAGSFKRGLGAKMTYELADDVRQGIVGVERRLSAAVDLIDRELRQAHDAAQQMRLVGTGTVVTALERIARGMARSVGKQIAFAVRGGDIRLDANVLAVVQGALIQLIRNAVAHGVESPAERRRAGKPEAGNITLAIVRRGNRIIFSCTDDGHGIDLDAVRHAAARRGATSERIDGSDTRELAELLLRGGISTSKTVTEIAGRGVGLDVVRVAVEELGGAVDLKTKRGEGTTFEIAVPLSLASIEALLVEAGGTSVAIPFDAVRTTMLLDRPAVSYRTGETTVVHDSCAVPFLWLPHALGGVKQPPARRCPCAVIASAAGLAAIGVERLLGVARIVVRSLPELSVGSPIVAGASLDGEGKPQLILSPEGLAAAARQTAAAEPQPASVRRPVLVVDDSLTTRMLEQGILEAAGYEVDLAVSAEEALEIARRRRYALFLVDVDMPGMTGFEFVECVRVDPVLRETPAILVTSRSDPADRQRGRDVGAQGYIVKGEFDQTALLSMIEPLVA
ncbi:MAG TPA: response regulator [Stellaceae bacterium]|jgi:two-component system chemotaxis sensor kinase CheA